MSRPLPPCHFRRTDNSAAPKTHHCELVTQITRASVPCPVTASVCAACAAHGPAGGLHADSSHRSEPNPAINPVVASLVLQSAESQLNAAKRKPEEQAVRVSASQTMQFAIRWLHGERGDEVRPWEEIEDDASSVPSDVPKARGAPDAQPRIGLVGPANGYGLAQQSQDIAIHLPITRWLVPENFGADPRIKGTRIDRIGRQLGHLELEAWLDGLDIVLFVERPHYDGLTAMARRCGVRVVCIPNWEWLHPGMEWLSDVDLMLCPTRYTAMQLRDWQIRFRFPWSIECVPWPINTERFVFRRRRFCRRYSYVHGSGGARAANGASHPLFRKGWETLRAALTLIPRVPVLVFADQEKLGSVPGNVQVLAPPNDNRQLYELGDVCVQPSHWEGLGLPLLECQASGMPLITADAPPMNEHRPFSVVPVKERVSVHLCSQVCITAATVDPEDLARVLKRHHRTWIAGASGRARKFVEQEHSWQRLGPLILDSLKQTQREFSGAAE